MWPPAYDDAGTYLPESSFSLPGGDYYADITGLVEAAANEMATGELVMFENFTLFDAMSAVQIMDARLDSSLASYPGAGTATFDVFALLSPEELCWVMDKTICAEMDWHQGHSLSQTVYTCLYFFEFSNLNPTTWHSSQSPDLSRPSELVTSVLKSWMQGLIKTCDMAWREYAQRHVYENEDVISDKSELSLMEGTRVDVTIESLESAKRWLQAHPTLAWCEDLVIRLELRSLLLQIFAHPPRSDASQWRSLILSCKRTLVALRGRPSPAIPSTDSSAFAAFDPAICRNLVNHIPLPVIELMSIDAAWDVLEDMLIGLERSCVLEDSDDLLVWKIYLTLSSHEPDAPRHNAYVRSRITTSFTLNGTKILNEHPREWIVPEILRTIADISPNVWEPFTHGSDDLPSSRASYAARIWTSFQGLLSDSLITYYKALSNNRPRQRRTYSKNMGYWRDLLHFSVRLSRQLIDFPEAASMSRRIPMVVLHFRLEQMAEVIFAGFEAELYSLEEMPFLYWYTSTVILSRQAKTLDELRREIHATVPESHDGQTPAKYVRTQFIAASALRTMSEAAFLGSMSRRPGSGSLTPSLKQIIRRRLEWAFQAQIATTVDGDGMDTSIPPPSFEQYAVDIAGISSQTMDIQQLGLWRRAYDLLTPSRSAAKNHATSRDMWELEHSKYIAKLHDACSKKIAALEGGMLQGHTPIADGVHNTQSPIHPWFPLT